MSDGIGKLLHNGEDSPEPKALPIPAHPEAGQVYAFRTRPFSSFSPQETGRHAAIKVLGVSDLLVVVAVLDGIWPTHPSLSQTARVGILTETRFAHTGRLAVFGAYRQTWDIEEAFTAPRFLGNGGLTGEERARASSILRGDMGTSTAWLVFANHAPEGEWRWTHDREALLEEAALRDAEAARERAEKEARYNSRLKGLTLDALLGETPFTRWTSSPPFPPEDFTKAARAAIHAACRDIQALGDKPRKAEVRKVLKRTVEWFNATDEAAGNVIETEEREDIMAALEEIAHAAKHKALVPEIDEWRDW